MGVDISRETILPQEPQKAEANSPPSSPFEFLPENEIPYENTSKVTPTLVKTTAAMTVSRDDVLSYRIQRLQNSGQPHRLLIEAISRQDILTCSALLFSTPSNVPGTGGRWPLHEAATTGNRWLVEMLLTETSNTFVTCDEGKSALEYATESGEINTVNFLYDHFDRKHVLPKGWDMVEILDRAIAIATANYYEDVKGFLLDKISGVRSKRTGADFLSAVTENKRKKVSAILDTEFFAESALKLAIEKSSHA